MEMASPLLGLKILFFDGSVAAALQDSIFPSQADDPDIFPWQLGVVWCVSSHSSHERASLHFGLALR
ncbi:hypothetical protein F2Q69_00004555 [Brassica cretica]|uniref:Secreted protein n=1 Tax=Brassica cretica TaxID=69181 RepID=A0A8S9NND8_BRACR|nr:hypothetical protein F2Q69_00004555 [Brassica cretica]